jgi:hypothetical protein
VRDLKMPATPYAIWRAIHKAGASETPEPAVSHPERGTMR